MSPTTSPAAPATILFVDDEIRVVNLLRISFRDKYKVLIATSGRDALEIMRTTPVDVLVSDQRMPEMLGIELLEKARQSHPGTIRILLTGYSDLSAIVGSVNDGEVFRFINKPRDQKDLERTLADAVDAARAGEQVMPAPTPDLHAPEVLLIDDSAGDLSAMRSVLESEMQVQCALSIPAALQILERRDIGVIVTEARVGTDDTGEFLRVLKQHYPLITTVMLTKAADADLVIRMINRAQIFRFATKPLRRSVFQLAVSAAMKEHQRYRVNPSLVHRRRVSASTEPEDQTLVAAITRSLSALRSRFWNFGRDPR